MSRHYTGSGEMHGLLAGSALAVHGHTGNGLRPTRGQHRGACDVEGLLTGLHDAAPDHIVDDLRVDSGPLSESVENLGRELSRVHTGQSAVALSDRCAHSLDNYRFRHGPSPPLG